jgi:hypothetical protein
VELGSSPCLVDVNVSPAKEKTMKRLSVVPVAAVAALLMVGCERAPSIAGLEKNLPANPAYDAFHDTSNEMDVAWPPHEDTNPCTGDLVTIAGSTHFLFVTTFDENGGFHVYTRANSTGTGTGVPSLYTYNVKDETKETLQSNSGGAGGFSQEQDVTILGPRSVDNYIRHLVFKLQMNANGVPTASFTNSYNKCVG